MAVKAAPRPVVYRRGVVREPVAAEDLRLPTGPGVLVVARPSVSVPISSGLRPFVSDTTRMKDGMPMMRKAA